MVNGKKSLPFVYVLVSMICSLLLLGWPFVSFGKESGISMTISGYGIITEWSSVWFVFSALLQILSFVAIVLMLVLSIWGWVASVGKAEELKIGKWGMKTITEFLFLVNTCLVILMFVFWVVGIKTFTIEGISLPGAITFGLMAYLILNIASLVAYLILRAKGVVERDGLFERLDTLAAQNEAVNGVKKEEKKTKSETPQQQKPQQKQLPAKQEEKQEPKEKTEEKPEEQKTEVKAEEEQKTEEKSDEPKQEQKETEN